jgi:glucose/arabinose dehydrogenase
LSTALNRRNKVIATSSIVVILSLSIFQLDINSQRQIVAQNATKFDHPFPILKDTHLKVELVVDGLSVPTGMLFLDKNNILVLQRYTSGFPLGGLTTVNLVTNGSIRSEPVLTVPTGLCDIENSTENCNAFNERGLLGISARKINLNDPSIAGNLDVYLYYTEVTLNGEALGNRVYRYLWDGNNLVHPKLVLDLPALPSQSNVGGKVIVGPDDYLYAVIGDVTSSNKTIPIHEDPVHLKQIFCCPTGHRGQLQNIISGAASDNTSVILRVNPNNGLPAPDNPFNSFTGTDNKDEVDNKIGNANANLARDQAKTDYNASLLSRYYAYGIRNSFGIAFDPITGNLWDTENGVDKYDEINLVEPGFNSGWAKVMGPINRINGTEVDVNAYGLYTWKGLKMNATVNVTANDLVNFPGSKYSDPEFSWKEAIGVTALGFLNSSKLGEKYRDNLFVGDYAYGNLYFFNLNKNRDGIEFDKNQTGLSDVVADNANERSKAVIGTGFDIITDIQTGPDGYLYIVSYSEYSNDRPDNVSRIYRIVPQ